MFILLYEIKNCFCLLGSYDHKMKLFDARMDKSVLTMDHGQPVESLLLFPSEGLLISAGGNSAKLNTLKFTLLPFCKCHICLGTLHELMCLCRPLKTCCCHFKVGVMSRFGICWREVSHWCHWKTIIKLSLVYILAVMDRGYSQLPLTGAVVQPQRLWTLTLCSKQFLWNSSVNAL